MKPTRRSFLAALVAFPLAKLASKVLPETVAEPELAIEEVLYDGACNTGKSGLTEFAEFIEATSAEECMGPGELMDALGRKGYALPHLLTEKA